MPQRIHGLAIAPLLHWRFDGGMPELTRRRSSDAHECWQVYYGDVHIGTIAIRSGNPHDAESVFLLYGKSAAARRR
jgi:hypothetical protein